MFKISNLFFDEKEKYNVKHIPYKYFISVTQLLYL